MKHLSHLNLNQNELQNAAIQRLASAPSSPVEGQIYYNTASDTVFVWANGAWLDLGIQGGAGATNLTTTLAATTVTINSDTGTDATIPAADTTNAGVMTEAMFDKLAGIEALADVTDAANVDAAGALMESEVDADIKTLTLPASTTISTFGASLVDDAAATNARTTLGLVIGTDVLAPNGNGSSLTGLTQGQITNLTSDLALKAPLASPTFTGTVTVPTPSGATDAANKGYVDNSVQGLSWKQAVRVASTANITIASALTNGSTIDGIVVATGDRVLLKDQSTGSQNGIYAVVASGAASRTADADTSAEVDSMTVYVEQGTANADTVWTLTTDNPTLGTTALVYGQINGGATPTATDTTQGKVELATVAETETRTDTTRAVTPAGLATFPRKYSATIGDAAATSIAVTHSLGSKDVISQVRQVSDDAVVECDIVNTSTTVTTFSFAVAPAASAIRVVIVG